MPRLRHTLINWMVLALMLMLVAACARDRANNPTAPSTNQSVAETTFIQAGTWKGAVDVTSCVRNSTSCLAGPEDFSLRIGQGLQGVVQITPNRSEERSDAAPIAVDVTGTPQADGATLFTGSTIVPDRFASQRALDLRMRLKGLTDGGVSGPVHYTLTGERGPVIRDGVILFASQNVTINPGQFQGTWEGYATRAQCSGDCQAWDSLLPFYDVHLVVSQSGSSITGLLNGLRVDGTTSGSSLSLEGKRSTPQCKAQYDGIVCILEVSNFLTTVDGLDHMRGGFTYHVEGFDSAYRHYDFRASADLVGVVRWP
jgi:hypothetical protein